MVTTHEVIIEGSTENGVEFSASILLESEETIVECGFVYGLNAKPNLQNNVLKVSEFSRSKYAIEIENVLRPDTTYYVRSFVRTEKYLIYGNEVSFYSNGSKAPVIEKIEPTIAFWGDTIMITGENFDHSGNNNKVFFNQFEAEKLWGTMDTIYAIVPQKLNTMKSEVKVRIYGQQSENSKSFEIHSPLINSISKSEGQYPDTVVVEGDYFYGPHLKIVLSEDSCNIISVDKKKVSFVVPMIGNGGNYKLYVNQDNDKIVANGSFKYNEQIIYGLSNDGVYYNEPMVIRAKNVDFTRFPFNIYLEESPMYSNYYTNYQDSVEFRITNPWYTLQKDNRYRINLGKYGYGKEIFAGNFSFKDPLFELLETETVINGSLKAIVRGRGYNGLCYINGPVVEAHYPSMDYWNKDEWSLDYDLPPGKYQFYYEDNLGKSEKGQFTIKQPILNSLDKNSYRRTDDLMVINGTDLPPNIRNGSSYFRIKHLESNRIFHFNGRLGNININEVRPLWLVGKGNYEVYMQLRDKKISNALQFTFEDDYVYVDSISGFQQPNHWNKKIVKWNNNLIVTEGYISYSIDLVSKTFKEINSIGNGIDNLFNQNGIVYAHVSHGPLYKLNDLGIDWDIVVDIVDGERIDVVYEHNNSIFMISESGQIHKLEGNGVVKQGELHDYQSILYVYSNNNELFCVRQTGIEVFDANTLTYKEYINIDIPELRKNEKNFVPTNNGLVLYDNPTMAIFFPGTRDIRIPSEDHLPGRYENILFSNEDGELFLMNEHFIYKYEPL